MKRIIHNSSPMIYSQGFTIIELIIVMVVITILSNIGISGFTDYSHARELNVAADDLKGTLNLARSNSLLQVKLPICEFLGILDGYKVVINDSATYTLYSVCGGIDAPINTETLPQDIAFTSTTPASFFFTVLTGEVVFTGPSTIVLEGFGKTRNITVSNTGVIR